MWTLVQAVVNFQCGNNSPYSKTCTDAIMITLYNENYNTIMRTCLIINMSQMRQSVIPILWYFNEINGRELCWHSGSSLAYLLGVHVFELPPAGIQDQLSRKWAPRNVLGSKGGRQVHQIPHWLVQKYWVSIIYPMHLKAWSGFLYFYF